ncbi:SUCROSE TRANSPORT PROTEIN SUC3 [Salix koriyanagi]|uniref:SUCROSE TRANSPORT PROTEIN SUC3 n=1 Tax=Salix koriyanagi TaxID=2511006 RepID=A0A9Q0WKS5_9ROSI|nr:SUCROSE TRANSPORT PROTEIN SUC3 [Salix koriyanagi]
MNVKHANSVRDQNENFSDGPGAVLVNLLTSLRHLPPGMHSVLVVMALTWLSWFPFFLFDADWMGKEVYHGDPKGNSNEVEFFMIKESEKVHLVCCTAVISLISVGEYSEGIEHVTGGNAPIRILTVFALLGFPLAITCSVPFSVTAELTADSGGGQGLAIGFLNLAIVIPQEEIYQPNLSRRSFQSGFHFGQLQTVLSTV